MYKAIEEAVKETLETLGLDAFKATSWFPSNNKKDKR